ncbi:reverse transcriptase-like protein [Sporosarcina sp. FA9]|uniref:reverse transcriptase-like protein n=1 Tax=Sporosarcina sp. FA9 TaxID=3413030 RepID=UPI003F65C29A
MKLLIEWTYKTPNGAETIFRSEEMAAEKTLLFANDLERTGRTKQLLFIDKYESKWTLKELKSYLKEIETEPHNVTVYFDGGFDVSTNKSGLGCVIYYTQSGKSYRLRKNALSHEHHSNNEAEYAALYLGIQELEQLNVHHLSVQFIGDSQVVINQLNDEWSVVEKVLSAWADRVEGKLNELGIQPEFKLIKRKKNAEADKLATQSLNGIAITATLEITKE